LEAQAEKVQARDRGLLARQEREYEAAVQAGVALELFQERARAFWRGGLTVAVIMLVVLGGLAVLARLAGGWGELLPAIRAQLPGAAVARVLTCRAAWGGFGPRVHADLSNGIAWGGGGRTPFTPAALAEPFAPAGAAPQYAVAPPVRNAAPANA